MDIIKFSNYIRESAQAQESQNLDDNDGILIIVDVQNEFDDFIPKNFEKNIMKYCNDFPEGEDGAGVYQIWDSNKAQNYSWTFPNTVLTIKKNYGLNFNKKIKKIARKLQKKYGNIEEGQKFKLKDSDTYLVKIDNNHKWFYVNPELVDLYAKLDGKKVVVIGGANFECLKDVYISMKSFGIFPTYNHNYIYSAETNDEMTAAPRK